MRSTRILILGSLAGVMLLALLLVWRERPSTATGDNRSLLLYCAAGIKVPVLEAARAFERDYGVRIDLQYGGSGTLLSNLQVARVGDLYLAADMSYMEIGREKGLVMEVLPLACQRPVIAVKQGNPKGIRTAADLTRADLRVALGNPATASIGKQTRKILREIDLWDSVQAQARRTGVFKPTVPEVANDVKLGAVDAGIVWDATVAQYPELEAVELPDGPAPGKDIVIGVLSSTQQPTLALRFARYLNSTVGNRIFKRHGYRAVAGDAWTWEPQITFFCGSINRRAVEAVVREFSEREGVTVNTVYNGCGILTGQMRTIRRDRAGTGFPDVYMACDRYYLDTVADWFQEDVDISDARIVIAVPKGNPAGITGLRDLANPGVRVAVGQPEQCTIGALTRILLEKEGVKTAVMANVVMQTASSALLVPTVTTHSVDAALAYNTDTGAEADKIDTISIDSPFAAAVQPFSIARSSRHKYIGRRLLDAVKRARPRFEKAGFHFRVPAPRTTEKPQP